MVDYYAQGPVYHPPGYDYTQQEEEWDREGLLDPAWEKQQKKVVDCFLINKSLFRHSLLGATRI